MSDEHLIRVEVNGNQHDLLVSPRTSLAELIREQVGLTGTHVTCQAGICGACTVVMDGEAVRSCIVLAVQADDAVIETVESLGTVEKPSALQQAFMDERALQCGFCTPGFLMLSMWFLKKFPDADDDAVLDAVSSNLCRCTGYSGILQAVKRVRDDTADKQKDRGSVDAD